MTLLVILVTNIHYPFSDREKDRDLQENLPYERLLWWIVRNVETHKRNSLGYKCFCMRPVQVSTR